MISLSARHVVGTSVMLAVFSMLIGCSGPTEKREYGVPKSLCGISVDGDLIAGFLPVGKEIEVREKKSMPGVLRCRVNVDGRVVLIASQEWWGEKDASKYVPLAYPQIKHAEPKDNGNLFYTGTGAALRAKSCHNPDRPGDVLYAVMQIYGSVPEDAPAMKNLIIAYTKAVEQSSECR